MDWADLSDDELRTRLTNHGLADERVAVLLRWRDVPAVQLIISGVLDA